MNTENMVPDFVTAGAGGGAGQKHIVTFEWFN